LPGKNGTGFSQCKIIECGELTNVDEEASTDRAHGSAYAVKAPAPQMSALLIEVRIIIAAGYPPS
jgi:hypothetical protein